MSFIVMSLAKLRISGVASKLSVDMSVEVDGTVGTMAKVNTTLVEVNVLAGTGAEPSGAGAGTEVLISGVAETILMHLVDLALAVVLDFLE